MLAFRIKLTLGFASYDSYASPESPDSRLRSNNLDLNPIIGREARGSHESGT